MCKGDIMITLTERNRVLDNFEKAVETKAEEVRGRLKLYSYYDAGVYDTVKAGILDIRKMIENQIPEGIELDAVAVHVSFVNNAINVILKNKYEDSATKFRTKFSVIVRDNSTNDTMYDEVIIGIYNVYRDLVSDYMIRKNVALFNAVMEELTTLAGVDYKISVVSPYMNAGKVIATLTDDEVVFVCDPERIFEIDTMSAMQVPGERFSEEAINNYKKAEADRLATAQTTAEVVENKGFAIIQFVCNIQKFKKPLQFLKKIASRNIQNNKKEYDGLYYYLKDNVFALVEVKDGAAEVVLSPFSTETFKRVDGVDVLGAFRA